MRKSWKEIADNIVVHMSREQMVAAMQHCHKRLGDKDDIMEPFERQSLIHTAKYLAECIAEYDAAF